MKQQRTQFEVWYSVRDRDRSPGQQSRGLYTRVTNKRRAIRYAKGRAKSRLGIGCFPRQVSVYAVPPGQKRGTLVHQCHFNSKLGRLITEEL